MGEKREKKRVKQVVVAYVLVLAMLFGGIPTVYAESTAYGIKPTSQKVNYDMASDLSKNVLFAGDTITSTAWEDEGDEIYYHGCHHCNKTGKTFSYANGMKATGDTDCVSVKEESVEYYVIENGKKVKKQAKIGTSMAMTKGPVLVWRDGNPERIQTDVFCRHQSLLETYYYSMNYPVKVEYLGADSFSVSYDLNGGILKDTKKNETSFLFSNQKYSYKLNSPVKLGYSMKWKEKNGVTGNVYVGVDELTVFPLTKDNWLSAKEMLANGGLQLVAQWSPADIKVVYDESDLGAPYTSYTVVYKAEDKDRLTTPLETPREVSGYEFEGYFIGDTRIKCLNDIPLKYWNNSNSYTVKAKYKKAEEQKPSEDSKPTEPPVEDPMPSAEDYAYILDLDPDYMDCKEVFDAGDPSAVIEKEGLEYDPQKNVLKMKDYEGTAIFAEAMGSAFTIELSGDNKLEQIYSRAKGYNGTVRITGTGTLTLSGREGWEGIKILADNTNTCLIIEDGVTINISAGKEKNAVSVIGSSNPNPIQLGKNVDLNGAKIEVSKEAPFDATIAGNTCKITTKVSASATVKKPAKVATPTVKSTKAKTITVSYKKVKNATGYQIRYSTSSKMTKPKYVDSKALKKTIKVDKSKKTYYVQVRAYVKDATGEKAYGSWSAKKSVKTK